MKTSLQQAFTQGNAASSNLQGVSHHLFGFLGEKSFPHRVGLYRKVVPPKNDTTWSHKRRYSMGFTLLEILVVLAIVAVLFVLSISMMNFVNSQDSKNQAVLRKMDVLEQQIKTYRLKNGAYPSDISTNPNN
jgi:prepilin-type N-terminal cleavage/methylation domain-containing protein